MTQGKTGGAEHVYGQCQICHQPAILYCGTCITCKTRGDMLERSSTMDCKTCGKLEIAGPSGAEVVDVLKMLGGASLLCRDRSGRNRVVCYANCVNPLDFSKFLNHFGVSTAGWRWESGERFDEFRGSQDSDASRVADSSCIGAGL